MTLDLDDCVLAGPAMTAPFLHEGLVRVVDLPTGIETDWDGLRGSLRSGGVQRVHQHVTAKLAEGAGLWAAAASGCGDDAGGDRRTAAGCCRRPTACGCEPGRLPGTSILMRRIVAAGVAEQPDADRAAGVAGSRRAGRTGDERRYRCGCCCATRCAPTAICRCRWTGGAERPLPPDSFRVLLALAGARGLPRLPVVLEAARLHQAGVTTDLRRQARDGDHRLHQCVAGPDGSGSGGAVARGADAGVPAAVHPEAGKSS